MYVTLQCDERSKPGSLAARSARRHPERLDTLRVHIWRRLRSWALSIFSNRYVCYRRGTMSSARSGGCLIESVTKAAQSASCPSDSPTRVKSKL